MENILNLAMIDDLIAKLDPLARKQLMVAFEQEMPHYIELDDNIFVGVNVEPLPHLQIIEQVGDWAYGKIVR